MDQAKANLRDAPEVWNRVAQQENEGNIGLIDKTLRAKVPSAEKGDFDRAAAAALTALRDFNKYLKNDLSHRTSDWRLGKEKYAKKFRILPGVRKDAGSSAGRSASRAIWRQGRYGQAGGATLDPGRARQDRATTCDS